jgi:hypothetical protein
MPATRAADAAIVAIRLDLGRWVPPGRADLNTVTCSSETGIIPNHGSYA